MDKQPRTLDELGELCANLGRSGLCRVVVPYERPADRAYISADGLPEPHDEVARSLPRVTFLTFIASGWTEAVVVTSLWRQIRRYVGDDKPALYWRARPSLRELWASGRDCLEESVAVFDHPRFLGSLRLAVHPERSAEEMAKVATLRSSLEDFEYREGVNVVCRLSVSQWDKMGGLFNRSRHL